MHITNDCTLDSRRQNARKYNIPMKREEEAKLPQSEINQFTFGLSEDSLNLHILTEVSEGEVINISVFRSQNRS